MKLEYKFYCPTCDKRKVTKYKKYIFFCGSCGVIYTIQELMQMTRDRFRIIRKAVSQ